MERALIIGASGGIGSALSDHLLARSVHVTELSRSVEGFDLTRPDIIADMLSSLETRFELVFVASGALEVNSAQPEKSIRAIEAEAMSDQFALNAIGPALVLKHAHDLLPRKGRSVFAVLSARVGSIGDNKLGGWISYRAAKAALNQIVRTSAIELARTHPDAIVVSLHPGTVTTSLTRNYVARHPAVEPADAAGNLLSVIDNLTGDQTGCFFDWAGQPIPW